MEPTSGFCWRRSWAEGSRRSSAATLFLGRQRVGGVYFGIITLAVAAILQLVVTGWSRFTGGSNGLYGFATPEMAPGLELTGTRMPYVVTAAVCVADLLRVALGARIRRSVFRYWRRDRIPGAPRGSACR